ncbi:hypothetical protein GCM10020221_22200 [Streptomyces thioluteus]|uniref:Protein kinase domain-containing protein n=1 Tax=Streptomyces thioluteus TaxID=66431 RepID=A0ABN3WRP1_STRTU
MEPLHRGDPRWIGPYAVVAGLDAATGDAPFAERRFVARSPDGDRTVLVCLPSDHADPGRFHAEADAARRLFGPWTATVDDVRADPDPWYTVPYLPGLPLPAALAAHGGPLPERTVRALGAALAEALAAVHATGACHAGLSPAAVLLRADGPLLTGFGALRAVAPEWRAGLASGTVAPEQLAGDDPLPPGDVFALGAVLAYAATGHTVPERDEIPEGLRPVISACLSRDPGRRPHIGSLRDQFEHVATPAGFGPAPAAFDPASPPAGPRPTVLDGGPGRAAALLTPGWLPARVVAALVRQSAELLAAEPAPA